MSPISPRRLGALLLPLLAACVPADDEGPGLDTEGPLYLAATWVSDVDATHTYVAVIDSLDVTELDFATAIEVPGWGDAWVHEGVVFVASGEAPEVSRYTLAKDGTLTFEQKVSFASYGVYGAAFWDQQILSATKAFLSDSAGRRYIEWNPTTMEIVGTVPWPELAFEDGLDVFHSYTDRGGVVADGHYFHGLYGHDETWTSFGDTSYVAVWDFTTNALVDTIEVPCPMMDVASLGDDGFLYVSGWTYMPLSYEAGYSDTNCAARIDVASRTLDTSWTWDYASAAEGRPGHGLRWADGSDGVFAVFHGTGVEVVEGMDMWALDAGSDDWELYNVDLETKAASPTGVRFGDGSYYESHIDGKYYVYLPGSAGTQVYERTANGYEPKLSAEGWMSRLFQVR